jgi:hypothetical protein
MRSVTRPVGLGWLVLIVLVLGLALGLAACSSSDVQLPGTSSTAAAGGVTTSAAADTSTSEAPDTTATAGATTTVSAAVTTTVADAAGSTTTSGTPVTTTGTPVTTSGAAATATAAKATTTTAKPTTTTAAASGPIVLKLSGPSGTKTFTMAELKALPAVSGYGGWKNQVGNITQPLAWKGPSLSSLMKLVGGGSAVTVIASDGYSSTVIPGASMGMYDPATGESIQGISVTAILAYAKDGGAMGGEEGPLRIAFVSPEKNQVTDGSDWARMVVELRVK